MQNSFSLDFKQFEIKKDYTVGKTPLIIFPTANYGQPHKLHVFCYGEDSNYDGEYSEGEELPSWWIIDSPDAEPRKILEFDSFFSSYNPRVGFDNANSILYIPLINRVVSIDLEKEEIDDDDVADITALAIDFAGGHLLLTVSGGTNEQGHLEVFNLQTSKVLQTIPAGINMTDCIYYQGAGGISIAMLNQGEYGSANGTIYYGSINHMFDFSLTDSVVVGETPNHIMFKSGKLYVTVNGSHCVKVIDVNTHEVETWYTGTIGWDGPRESYIDGNKLFVTTYSGDIRVIDMNTGNLIGVFSSGRDIDYEGITKWNGLITTTSPTGEFYSTNNKVFTWIENNNDFFSDTFVDVGLKPVGLFYGSNGVLNVVCAGNDEDLGVTDYYENPSIWRIVRNGNSFLSYQYLQFDEDKFDEFPFNGILSGDKSQLYIPAEGRVKSYSLLDENSINYNLAPYTSKALATTSPISESDPYGNYLFIATATESGADSVIIWDVAKNQYVSSFYAGDNIVNLEHFVGEGENYRLGIAILRKDPNTLESSISYGTIINGEYNEMKTEIVGKNAIKIKSLKVDDNIFLGVISLDDNLLSIINVDEDEITHINLGTQSNDGPADLIAIKLMGFVSSTYLGDFRSVNIDNNGFMPTYRLEGIIPMGISMENAVFCDMKEQPGQAYFAATEKQNINELPYHRVKILYHPVTSVQDYPTGNISQIKIYPNPSTDFINIETSFRAANGNAKIQIISMTGIIIEELSVPATNNFNHTIDIRKAELSIGTYFLRIINGQEIKSLPFNIVK